jgi:hypothetical protein
MSEEPASKDFVDRSIAAERTLTDEKFKSRDNAIKLLADGVSGQRAIYVAIGLSVLSAVLALVLKFLVK